VFLGTDWNVVQISADFSEFFGRYGTENFPNPIFFLNLKENATKWQNTHVKKKKKKEEYYLTNSISKKIFKDFYTLANFLRKASFRGIFHHIWKHILVLGQFSFQF
jgi:hypothetical protein